MIVLAGPAAAQAPSEDVYQDFQTNCTSCHTIGGGRLAGPDLKDVTQRQTREWLLAFIPDPKRVIDGGDPYAQKLFREAKGVYMTPPPGITSERAGRLLDLIEYESTLETSRFHGLQLDDRPLTEADVDLGRALFTGARPFENGAPACYQCHSVTGLAALGGGRLGPDLTAVYSRLEGKQALAAWLGSPPSLVMGPIFRSRPLATDEVIGLTAFLKSTADTGQEQARPHTLAFLLAGFGVAALVLVLFDVVWRDRYRATRRPLVEAASR